MTHNYFSVEKQLKKYLLCCNDECSKDCEELKCYNDVEWRTQFKMQEVK